VLSLKHSGALTVNAAGEIVVQKSLNKHTTFYSQMFEPFLLAYWVSVNCCLHYYYFDECCRFQPDDRVIFQLRGVDSVRLQILLVGTCQLGMVELCDYARA